MLFDLARCMRAAGLGVSIEEIADVLWLAQQLPWSQVQPERPPAVAADDAPDANDKPADDPLKASSTADATLDRKVSDPKRKAGETSLFTRQVSGTLSASTLKVPGVASTEHPEDLRRALQPFARRVPSRWRSALDEDATAARAAETRLWCPVYRPVRERWFDLSVVVESSASMALWDDTLSEFMRLLRNQGGFRQVRSYRLDDAAGGLLRSADGRTSMSLANLLDGDRPHLMLLVSDTTSARWRNGRAHAFLCEVGQVASVSVVQPLPRRSWRHTAVGEPEIGLFCERAGDANARMKSLLPWWLDHSDLRDCMRVPVIGLDAATIRQWARTMTAGGGAAVPAVLLAKASRAQSGTGSAETAAAPKSDDSPAARVARYRAMASQGAYELAVFLSVPDPLTVPVMRLVQRTMLPGTGTAELAEFFVGGLIRYTDDGAKHEGEACYRFLPGVREELMKSLRYSEEGDIREQLRAVGRHLQEHGSEGRTFEAYFPSPTGRHRITEWSLPFASVSKEVLRSAVPANAEAAADGDDEAAGGGTGLTPEPSAVQTLLMIDADRDSDGIRYVLVTAGARTELFWTQPSRRPLLELARQERMTPRSIAAISQMVSMPDLAQQLSRAECLDLVIDEELRDVPWECVLRSDRSDGLPIGLTIPVLRQSAQVPATLVAARPASRQLIWVSGDPDGTQPQLPGAQREASDIAALMQPLKDECDIETDIRGSMGDLVRALEARPFRMLFISGHGVRSVADDGTSICGVQYGGGGQLLQAEHILAHDPPPELVFLACNYLADMAPQLLRGGVKAVVAAKDVVDEHSDFAVRFFDAMVSGATFADAVLKARQSAYERHSTADDATWAQYQCFGSGSYRLVDREVDAARPPATAVASDDVPLKAATPEAVPPPGATSKSIDHETQSLLAACSAVPHRSMPSGVHTAVWFGNDMALTIASRTPGDALHWDDADTTDLPYVVSDVWGHLVGLAERHGGMDRLIADRSLAHIVERETARSAAPQLLMLIDDDGSHSRRVMPLAADDAVTGPTQAQVVYFVGERGLSVEVNVAPDLEQGTLQLTPRDSARSAGLRPEMQGAPLIVEGQCIGMLERVAAGGRLAQAKDARTLRAALRAAWHLRLHAGLKAHHEWVKSRGDAGQRLSLAGADLSGCIFPALDLREAELPAVRFTGSVLDGARFDRANLRRARLDQASLRKSTFVDADLESASLRGAALDGCQFDIAHLRDADFVGASIQACRWADADFKDAKFDRSHATDAALRRAVGLGSEEFIRTMTDGPPGDTQQPITVIAAADFARRQYASVRQATLRFIASGDSWFAGTFGSSLLHSLSFAEPALAMDSSLPWLQPRVDGHRSGNMGLIELLGGTFSGSIDFDGVLLSLGGDDLVEAASVLPFLADGKPTRPEQRLLLRSDEWKHDATPGQRYISEQGMRALRGFLQAHLDQIVHVRDRGPMRGRPIFIHGYADPVPRPARSRDGRGPWLQPAMSAYGLPIEHHLATAQALMSWLRGMLRDIASDEERYPAVHFFDSSQVPLLRAGANQPGEDGDWSSEWHPNASGFAKLAKAWSEEIASVLRPRQNAA